VRSENIEAESDETLAAGEAPSCEVVQIETLRRHRQLVQMREWLAAQVPWQRGDARRIRNRIRAA
jgi:hypothetical protein